jgi:hypothetical protein
MAETYQCATNVSTDWIDMSDKYFDTECRKCGWQLTIQVADKNEYDYYLCDICAFSKAGM